MAGNPLISQGTINLVRASLVVPALPNLNVTASFLGKGGINVALRSPVTTFVDALTGRVTVPEPYCSVGITVNLLRSQQLAQQWIAQILKYSQLGDITVIPDTTVFPNYQFTNCAIESAPDQAFASGDAAYNVVIGGTWLINNDLWNMV
jgi:hypothetical protein